MKLIRKNSSAMKARQYQIVAVCGIMHNEYEYEVSFFLTNSNYQHMSKLPYS